ncbi:hypothetical protein CSA17_04415 [bacterium DOLJORAL78_65_58]|nr:MAG: hypothetical protein CSB20_02865 [bacterium DOLZORAL124_64_63]PIE76016.1 MAG: hypothetical protein CSA17_04415 [bacterium DOLJORAL78_65_58]
MILLLPMLYLLPLLYLGVFGLYFWLFRYDHPWPRKVVSRLAAGVVVIHTAVLVARGLALDRFPIGSPLEFASTAALGLLATYLVIERRIQVKSTGVFVSGAALILQGVVSAFIQPEAQASDLLADPGFAGHAVLVLASYTALLLSFLFALLYLIQTRQLNRKQFGILYRRLPSLAVLERMSVGAVKIGVVLMFLSLCLGHLWMYDLADRLPPELAGQLSPWDPKIMVSWVIFLGYLLGLTGHRFLGWRGRRMNVMAVTAFLVIILSLGLMHHFVPSFHRFRGTEAPRTTPARPLPGDDLLHERRAP